MKEQLIALRDEMLHEAEKTGECYTCYTDQAAYVARRLDAILSASKPADVPYVERFSESSGEGGGVYPDEDGDFMRYADFVEYWST